MEQRKETREKLIKTLKDYRTWQLIFFFIVFGFVVMTLLRMNNTSMKRLRDAVQLADKDGNQEIMRARLADLQQYVMKHMNASTGRFFLEGQFRRDSEVIIEEAKKAANSSQHGNVYKKASEVCDPQFTRYSAPYFQCYMNEIAKYPTATYSETEVKLPNPNMYQVEFISPKWSSDWAGLSLVAWIFLGVVIVMRTLGKIILLLILSRNRKKI